MSADSFFEEYYCALCSAPLSTTEIEINRFPLAEKVRERREQKRRARLDGETLDERKEFRTNYLRYDSKIIKEDPEWLADIRCIRFNWDIDGLQSYTYNHQAVYPFHQACFEILSRVITGNTESLKILDKDIFYHVFSDLQLDTRLGLDYGSLRSARSIWQPLSGEEFAVVYPLEAPGISKFLKSVFKSFDLPILPASEGQYKNTTDCFSILPNEILQQIVLYLPGMSVTALCRTSRIFQMATYHNAFWKGLIRHRMPWFWELQTLLHKQRFPNVNLKQLFLYLEKELSVPYGLELPLAAIAKKEANLECSRKRWRNRRYHESSPQLTDSYFHAITADSILSSTQWICSWDELAQPEVFEVYYTRYPKRYLTGLSIAFHGTRRIFGSPHPGRQEVDSYYISHHDRIRAIRIFTPDLDLDDEDKGGEESYIVGCTLLLESGMEYGPEPRKCLSQTFAVSEGYELVGVLGQVEVYSRSGLSLVARFGILECHRPSACQVRN
ncbi:hypothetical protein BDV12DRAFT_194267 [Aspergillus spectabilis]